MRNSIASHRPDVRRGQVKSTSLRALAIAAILERQHEPDAPPGHGGDGPPGRHEGDRDGHKRPTHV